MGITHFFHWFKTNFRNNIKELAKGQNMKGIDVEVDNFLIDLNGLFHASTQKIYQYGNHAPRDKKFRKNIKGLKAQLMVFEDVCQTISNLVEIVDPNKRLILCTDGVAPVAKQCQQRQRRFRASKEQHEIISFNSNCITPGTKFMDYLSKYIDWFIRKEMNSNPVWQNLEIIFSNEKSPSEGEHKAAQYIRKYGSDFETYCFQGMDADLIMLALATQKRNFYILREDIYNPSNEYFCINIGSFREELVGKLTWDHESIPFNAEVAVTDFVFICFMVGNDFLPHLPCISIIDRGIEVLLDLYRVVGSSYGHLTCENNNKVYFNKKSLKVYLQNIGMFEKDIFEYKLSKKESWFPEKLLSDNSSQIDEKWEVDIDSYKRSYMNTKFPDNTNQEISHEYLTGLQWVLSYYTRGVPSWEWSYKHYYAPPASILAEHVDSYKFTKFPSTRPFNPLLQLLCVLPPKSVDLLPEEIRHVLVDKKSQFHKYCPEEFTIDIEGKSKEWQGIVILPIIDLELIKNIYFEESKKIGEQALRMNRLGKTFRYKYNKKFSRDFKSYYGDIENSNVCTEMFII
jgi:5'-3' exoribonuclease 1